MKIFFILFLILFLTLTQIRAETFKETLQKELTNIEVPEQVRFIFPVIKVTATETHEEFLIKGTGEGNIILIESDKKPDITIEGTESNFKKILSTKSIAELKTNIDLVNIKVYSLKGKFGAEIIEDLYGIKIIKERSFSQNIINVIVAPTSKIISLFK